MTQRPHRPGISRRGFVTGALGTGVAVGAGALAGCSSSDESPAARRGGEVRSVRGSAPNRDHRAADSRTGPHRVVQRARQGQGGAEVDAAGTHRGDPRADGGQAAGDARPRLSARRFRNPRGASARGQPLDRGRCRGVVVRRPVRLGRSQTQGIGHHAVPCQRPARSQAVARGYLDHLGGRAQRHRAVRVAAVDAPHPKRSGAAVDDRRLRPRHRRGPGVRSRDAAKPVGVQGRNGQPQRRRRRPDGSPRLGGTRRRRARVGGRRFVSGGAHHPDVRRILGPHAARRAGER